MKKRAIVIATSLAFSPAAHASDFVWYGGGAVQRSALSSDFYFTGSSPGLGSSNDDSDIALKLFGGIRQPSDWGYYGAELALDSGGAEVEGEFRSGLAQRGVIEEEQSISLSLVAGVAIRPESHLYGRIGQVRTSFGFESLSSSGARVASDDDDFTDTEFAVGLDHQFTPAVALRLEFAWVDYSDDFEMVGNVTGDIGKFDDVSRDAISIGIFTTF